MLGMALTLILVVAFNSGAGWPGVEFAPVRVPTPYVTPTPTDPEPQRLFNMIVRLRRELIVNFRKAQNVQKKVEVH
jgi:hypothetical protein